MHCSRWALSLLALYLFLEVAVARPRIIKEVSRVEQEQDQDLTAGWDVSAVDSEHIPRPTAVLHTRHNQHTSNQRRRKAKVARVDSIGSSLMLTFRKAKD